MTLTAKETSPIGHNNPPNDAEILKETLARDHDDILSHAQKLVEAADRIPAIIEDEETANKAADFIKQATAGQKKLEAVRVNEKEPYLTLGRVVDGFFKNVTDKLDGAKAKAKKPLDVFLKNKAEEERRRRMAEAEAQRRIAEENAKAAAALEKAKMNEQAETMFNQATIAEIGAERLDRLAEAKPSELSRSRSDSGALASLRTVWVGEVKDTASLDLEKLRHHLSPDALQKALNSFVKAGGRELRGASIFEKSETVVR